MDNTTKPNGFLSVLQKKETQVGILTEASNLLGKAAQASLQSGKKSKITLEIEISPKLNALNFATRLKSSIPAEEEPLCIFYTDSDGGLYRDDPRQKQLPLEAVNGGKQDEPKPQFAAVV